MGLMCLPTSASILTEIEITNILPSDNMRLYISDIWKVKKVAGLVVITALVIGFVFILLMKKCVKYLIWLIILFIVISLTLLTWNFYQLSNGKRFYI